MPVAPEVHDAAAGTLMLESGHHRKSKAAAYIGSYEDLKRGCDGAVKSLHERFQDPRVIAELHELGVTGLLLIGKAAGGRIDSADVTVCAYDTAMPELVAEDSDSLAELLEGLIGTQVCLAVRTPEHMAAEYTLEVM